MHTTTPIAVIGLGYVGLPLAVEFGRVRPVVGFDINPHRIDELRQGHDATLETTPEQLQAASQLRVPLVGLGSSGFLAVST